MKHGCHCDLCPLCNHMKLHNSVQSLIYRNTILIVSVICSSHSLELHKCGDLGGMIQVPWSQAVNEIEKNIKSEQANVRAQASFERLKIKDELDMVIRRGTTELKGITSNTRHDGQSDDDGHKSAIYVTRLSHPIYQSTGFPSICSISLSAHPNVAH